MKSFTRYACTSAAAALFTLGASGCALTSKGEALDVRYFTPEHAKPKLTSGEAGGPAAPAAGAASPFEVRLGRVTSGTNLRERIAYRDAAYEIGYYDDRRWTERPETFVRRELGRTLFEERGFKHVFGGASPTLDVEVVSFDELRLGEGRAAARVQLKVVLYEDRGVLLEDTITVDKPIASKNPKIEEIVGAMAEALDGVSAQVADKVKGSLEAHASELAAKSTTTTTTDTTATVKATTTTTTKAR